MNKHFIFMGRLMAKWLFLLLGIVVLPACTIHRIDVQQGNVITEEMVDKLKVGMNERQVRFIMGSPMLQDPFHRNRWEYLYTLQPGDERKITNRKRVTLYFDKENLIKINKLEIASNATN